MTTREHAPDRSAAPEDPVAALRRLAAGGGGAEPPERAVGGGPLRAWDAVRSGRWAATPRAALGVGLVALLVCSAVLVRAHLLAPEQAPADAGQRVAITTAAEDAAEDAGPEDAGPEGSAAQEGDPVAAAAGTGAGGPVVPAVGGGAGAPPGTAPADGLPALVHVVGQVRSPGVVEVPPGGRVADAVAAAGGLTGEADPSALNLARAVVDGEQVVVPRPGEVPVVAPSAVAPATGGAPGVGVSAATGAGGPSGGPVPLDTATAAELDALPGIGPVLAQRIVDWREANGGFSSTDELGEVSGIGDKVLEQLRPLVAA